MKLFEIVQVKQMSVWQYEIMYLPIHLLHGQDVPKEDLEAILDYMYAGTVKVAHSNLASLLHTAEGLQVKGLIIPEHFRGTPSSSKYFFNVRGGKPALKIKKYKAY